MSARVTAALFASALLAACAAGAPTPEPPPAPPAAPVASTPPAAPAPTAGATDYANAANWLCLPGKANDACSVDLTATVVNADGSTAREPFAADPNAPIDCFYVYPTVSLDPYSISDLNAGPEELSVIRSQFARFGSKCRLYAPLYRQITLAQLRAGMGGAAPPQRGGREEANADIDAAWEHYLKHYNNGRGVILIGHSQGAGQITRLIQQHIEGKPVADRMISAMVIGWTLQSGPSGTLKSTPVCTSDRDVGCLVNYVSFRDTVPPAPTARFGRDGDGPAICTAPSKLIGDTAGPRSYFTTGTATWVKGKTIDTPFVRTPGLVTTRCVAKDGFHYLEVKVNAVPADPRADDMGGDIMANGKPDAGWGLHLIDMNLEMGDLVELAGRQGAAWSSRQK
ncbi:DUF3089 domain-containing protein [bacterium]|nr:DUF3089 domain-containing protein [bacterium]